MKVEEEETRTLTSECSYETWRKATNVVVKLQQTGDTSFAADDESHRGKADRQKA